MYRIIQGIDDISVNKIVTISSFMKTTFSRIFINWLIHVLIILGKMRFSYVLQETWNNKGFKQFHRVNIDRLDIRLWLHHHEKPWVLSSCCSPFLTSVCTWLFESVSFHLVQCIKKHNVVCIGSPFLLSSSSPFYERTQFVYIFPSRVILVLFSRF